MEKCEECEGTGVVYMSCCGDDMSFYLGESDLCPTCSEHCGEEGEDCYECGGTGRADGLIQAETRHYIITQSKSNPDMFIYKNKNTNSYFVMESYPEYVRSLHSSM